MDAALEQLVWQRAKQRCEYCRLAQADSVLTFEIDHIIPRKHGGTTRAANLALSCFYCNRFRGSDLTGLDPQTGELTRLFNPRRHKWQRHFRWDGPALVGRTAIGRTTVVVLQINLPVRVAQRAELIAAGLFPPAG
jgi:hypothetical protein